MPDAREWPRHALTVGVSAFARPPSDEDDLFDEWPALPFAPTRQGAVEAALRRLGYECVSLAGPEARGLGDAIWSAARRAGRDGVLVVHVLSHGYVSATGGLYVVGADGRSHERAEVGAWLRAMVDFPDHPQTLFLLDVCNSGAAARLDWQVSSPDGGNKVWVIASCGPRQSAFDGRFSQAVANVLGSLGGAPGGGARLDLDQSVPFAPLSTVAREIRREVRQLAVAADAPPQDVTGTLVDISVDMSDLPFFPNRWYQPRSRRQARPAVDAAVAPFLDDLDEALDAKHFVGRAAGHGATIADSSIGCFSGRGQELRDLSAWVDGQSPLPLRIVTGSPGVGKSALLGVLVCAAHPRLREPTIGLWKHVDRAPYLNQDLVAVHARQRSLDQIVASLGDQLGSTRDVTWSVASLIATVRGRHRPPVVVVDALDEAGNAAAIMNELLLPLSAARRADGGPACRMLVAMRPWPEFDPLREAASAAGVVDLDQVPEHQLRYDLERYVDFLLRQCHPYGESDYTAARATFADTVARKLTEARAEGGERWGEFLVAGLFTNHLVHAHRPVDDATRAREIGAQVPRSLPDLLELDLSAQSHNPWLRPVLAVLANAKGSGMPARVLGTAAGASPPDVAAALDAARFYLRHASDSDGTTLYRLFHQGLADHLQLKPVAGQAAGAGPAHRHALLDRLLADTAQQWDLAEPYLRRHAVAHAADVDRVAELFGLPEFLVHAEPPDLLAAAAGRSGRNTEIYRRALAPEPDAPVARRRELIALAATEVGALDLAYAVANPPGAAPLPWQPGWVVPAPPAAADDRPAAARPPEPYEILPGRCTAVSCATSMGGELAAAAVVSGRIVDVGEVSADKPAVYLSPDTRSWSSARVEFDLARSSVLVGSDAGTALIVDRATGDQQKFRVGPKTAPVLALTISGDPKEFVVATDTTIGRYDLRTGAQRGRKSIRTAAHAAAFARIGSSRYLLSTDELGALSVTPVDGPEASMTVAVGLRGTRALAAAALDGRLSVVAARGDELIVLTFVPREREAVVVARVAVPRPASTVACGYHRRDLVVLFGAGPLYRLRLDPSRASDVPVPIRAPAVTANVGEVDGRRVALTSGPDGGITLRDLRDGAALTVLRGHDGGVRASATGRLPGGPVVVSIGADRTIRLWDARRGEELARARVDGDGGHVAVADFGTHQVAVTDTGERWRLPTLERLPGAPQPAVPPVAPEAYGDLVKAVPLTGHASHVVTTPGGSLLAVVNGAVVLFRHADDQDSRPAPGPIATEPVTLGADAAVARWLVHEGQPVRRGEPVAVLTAGDGAESEARAPGDGVLRGIVLRAGERAAAGATIAVVATYVPPAVQAPPARSPEPPSHQVTMPRLGEKVTEGTVTRWLKRVGDRVEADEPLLEVSTDKVDTEIPSPAAGVLHTIEVGEDETVEVGVVLAWIRSDP